MYTPQNTLTKNKTPVSKLENSPTFKDLTPLKSNNPIASRSLSFSSPSLPCVFTSPDHKELCFTSHNNYTIDKEEVVSHGEDGDSIEIKPLKDSCEEVEMDFQKMCDNNIKAKTDIPDFEKMMTTSDSGVLIYIPTNDNKEAHRFLLKTTSNSISKPSHNLSIFNRGLKGRRCLDFETVPTYTHILDGFISKYEVHSKGKYLNPIALSSKGNQVSNEYSLQSSKTPAHDNLDGPRGEEEVIKSTPLGLLNQTSPKKKRLKTEQAIEGKSLCKRCNCKKSKCLKLYCECFAAGLYCLEPCSCLDCCNKHIYQELVSDTRRKIMLRNPLAFGPKVIKNSVSFVEAGHDATSELHKRGCHCKRSNCLKKYCECFQSRVGCSTKCRCEGCNNTFGINDESSGPKPIISLGRGSNHVNLRSLGYN